MTASGWEAEVQPDGRIDLRLNRRIIHYDLDDMDEALRIVRRQDGRGTEVAVIEGDGYRTRARA